MNEFNNFIDRCIYEIAESVYDSEISFKKIDSDYNTMKLIFESGINSEGIVLEEENVKKDNAKKGVIRTLIDGIINKIQKLINFFKGKDDESVIKPDDKAESSISEEDFRDSTNKLDVVGQKLDSLIEAAKGNDKDKYKKALQEYDDAVNDLNKRNKEMLKNVKEDDKNFKETHAKKHYVIKGVGIGAGIYVVRKAMKKAKANAETLKNNESDQLLLDIFDNSDEREEALRGLVARCGKIVSEGGKFREIINDITYGISGFNKKNKNNKNDPSNDNDDNNDETDEDNGDVVESVIRKSKGDNGDKAFKGTLQEWLVKYCRGDLDNSLKIKEPRPKFTDSSKLSPYLINTNKTGFLSMLKSDASEKSLRKRVRGFVNRENRTAPIFFDIWGLFYTNPKISLDEYVESQKKLLDQVRKIREEEKMPRLLWDKSAAFYYLTQATRLEPTKHNKYSWSCYIMDR